MLYWKKLTFLKKVDNISYEKVLKRLFPYNIISVIVFFSLPFFTLGISESKVVSTILLFGMMRVYASFSFFSGLLFGLHYKFHLWHPIATAIIFSITIFIYYLDFGLFLFSGMYFVCALVGCWLGSLLKRHSDEMYL